MKALEAAPARPRLYTIPPLASFLASLAKAMLDGDLPFPGGPKLDPASLPLATIYLPTRRATRALRQAFLDASGGQALLLPRIRALGDPDEDQALILSAQGGEDDALPEGPGPAPIGRVARHLDLMRLILAWSEAKHRASLAESSDSMPLPAGPLPAQASFLAADLARLMDFLEQEETDLTEIERLVPEALAEHWQDTVDFLEIVTEHWPEHLAELGLVSPMARRNSLMALEAERLATTPSPYPVIAAGSTGTVPATARLLKVIASLPNGAVVLPGLDFSLDDASWESLGEHPEHPQFGMAELLRKFGLAREHVVYVPGTEPTEAAAARLGLLSEVLRPADSTDLWRDYLAKVASDGEAEEMSRGLEGLDVIEAPTPQDEAEAVALILRSAIEEPHRTAALVTPDRVLARRVAARLKGYGIEIDDSAGVPVARTSTGAFLDLVLTAAAENFGPAALMALLKHPLTLLGRGPGEIRTAARALERGAFREVYLGGGLSGAAAALEEAQKSARRQRSIRLSAAQFEAALQLLRELERDFAPLAAMFGSSAPFSAAELARAHSATAEALARGRNDRADLLWQDDAGEAISLTLAELIASGEGLRMRAADYPAFYRSLIAGQVVRPLRAAHPRLSIWGPLEARLQRPDIVILGSLNEGTWPRQPDAGPWLSRSMYQMLGLPLPERRIGLAAHDFAQNFGAPSVYLTRALKVEGVPTVPSRWLQRLKALAAAAKQEHAIAPERPWVAWGRERDRVEAFAPVDPPRPCPPVELRPQRLSVSRIETWIANPYAIFARDILKLQPLKPLGAEIDAANRGELVHQALSEFARCYPDALPHDIGAALIEIGDKLFAKLSSSPRVAAFWRPQFARFAHWFAATEPGRRATVSNIHSEVTGSLDLPVEPPFRLTARADRIDVTHQNSLIIYDYKTGKPPNQKQVDGLFAPQLPLEAAIAERGGFEPIGALPIKALRYIEVSGRHEGGDDQHAARSRPDILAAQALDKLSKLVRQYADPRQPYEVKRRKAPAFARAYDYDDYEQLARVKEWLTQELDEDWRR